MSGGFPFPSSDLFTSGQTIGTTPYGTSVAPNASAHTKGSWTQIIASTTYDATWIHLMFDCVSSLPTALDLAVGAASSEVPFATNLMNTAYVNAREKYQFPVTIPAGSRISARCQSNGASSASSKISLILFDTSFPGAEYAGVDDLGFDAANTRGTTVDPTDTNTVKGSWTQIISSTSRDYAGLMMNVLGNSVSGIRHLIDIGIGGAGSEIAIIPNYGMMGAGASSEELQPNMTFPMFVPIPAGTRLSCRVAYYYPVVFHRYITLYGLY